MYTMLQFLHKKIDNAPLIAFRIILGVLLAWHCVHYLAVGNVYKIYMRPRVTFNFIGLDWLQPLPGNGMYWYYGIMALLGLCIAAGFLYRYTMGVFTLLWAGSYFMQKEVYNNHHYLLLLLCIIMLLLPANTYASIDSRLNPKIKRYSMPFWCAGVLILQMALVYFYAAVAKLYPDWLDGTFTGILLSHHHIPYTMGLLQNHYFHLFIAYGGILFDLLIVPLLLYKKTRNLAAVASVGFHFFNWLSLSIGIFPFLSLGYLVFFYPPDTVRRLFFKGKPAIDNVLPIETKYHYGYNNVLMCFFVPYFILQLALPLRHHFIKGDVVWTEEGHRLSWRMMLRFKSGKAVFKVIDRETGKQLDFEPKKLFTRLQLKNIAGKADMLWQAAQFIKKDYAAQGKDVAVYVTNYVSLNKHPKKLLIDPATDLTQVHWNYWGHNNWVLIYDDYRL